MKKEDNYIIITTAVATSSGSQQPQKITITEIKYHIVTSKFLSSNSTITITTTSDNNNNTVTITMRASLK